MKNSKLIIIDGNSLLFRSYFAMRPMVTKDGIYTQGIFAFINILNKILYEGKPDYLVVAFDVGKKTFRHEIFSEYKAGRQKTPIELLNEIPILHDVLGAMNIKVMEKEMFEADDIIGTVTAEASRLGMRSVVITGDKDELQLVDENTHVIINRKGMSEFDRYDLDRMKERYGLSPAGFIDLKGLMGDSSDNLPGVPGVGEKKGMSLLHEYGTLDSVIENKDEIKGKLGENIRNNVDSAIMTRDLATIKRDVPIDIDWDSMKYEDPDYGRLIEIYKKLEFNSFLKKIGAEANKVEYDNDSRFENVYKTIKDIDAEGFFTSIKEGERVAISIDTDDSHLRAPEARAVFMYAPESRRFSFAYISDPKAFFEKLLSKGYSFIGHNLKEFLFTAGYYCRDMAACTDLAFDTMIAEYLLNPNSSRYEISKMLLKHCGQIWREGDHEGHMGGEQISLLDEVKTDISEDERTEHKKRLFSIAMIMNEQEKMLEENGLKKLFETCEMPLIHVVTEMELNGVRVDITTLKEIGTDLDAKIVDLEKSITGYAGRDFNINSPKQLGTILFEEMDLPYPKKRGKGGYSTSVDVLGKIRDVHPIVREVLEYRKCAKLKSTYIDGLIALVGSDGRIHPHFNQSVAATGRLSCTEPNLQNIPIRDEYGRKIRKAFVAACGMTFVGSDYSQIELRIMAALSGDRGMLESFKNGEDIHRRTAAKVFNIPFEDVTPLERSRAKAVNFGIIYGMSGFGLSEGIHVSRNEAEKYINDYFKQHEAVKKFLDEQVEKGMKEHQVRTVFGRIRQIPEFTSRKYTDIQQAKRLAMNTPIQGSAADIIKTAMNKVYKALRDENLKSKIVLQIHDELIVEAYKGEAEAVKRILRDNMECAADLGVELTVDIHDDPCWYNLK